MVLGNGVGHTGIAQLHIGHVALAAQIQNAGVIELHPVLIFVQTLTWHQSCVGLHHHIFPGNAVVKGVAADAPGAIAAHLPPGTVGVVEVKPEIGFVGIVHRHKAVGACKFT